jgi:type IV pilus assembly protein PilW
MKHKGMTLIELMVAMVIGLGITLAVSSLLIASENHKRTTTSTNDAQQTGSYGYYALEKALRGAGSGIARSAFPPDVGVLGCHLNAGTILPRATAFPLPFAAFLGGVPGTLNVAPVLIGQSQSQDGVSDVIMVMGGSGAAGGVSRQITGGGNANAATLDNTVGFAASGPSYGWDLVLVSKSGTPDCLMEQVATIAPPTLNLGGIYYTATGGTANMGTLAGSTSSYVTPIGNAVANNVQFMLFGVDNNRTLFSYDLLQNLKLVGGAAVDSAQAIADGVVQMNALYGLDTNGDGIQDIWAAPGGPSDPGWDINTVMNSPLLMQQIVSVRVALVVRGEYYDTKRDTFGNPIPVSPPTLTIFNGLVNGGGTSLKQNINLNATDQQFRYRVFEFTVPLRNMLMLAGGA